MNLNTPSTIHLCFTVSLVSWCWFLFYITEANEQLRLSTEEYFCYSKQTFENTPVHLGPVSAILWMMQTVPSVEILATWLLNTNLLAYGWQRKFIWWHKQTSGTPRALKIENVLGSKKREVFRMLYAFVWHRREISASIYFCISQSKTAVY